MTNCQICGSELSLIPAGVSKKTGKPYNSFMACPNKCKSPLNNTVPQTTGSRILPTIKENDKEVLDELQAIHKTLKGLCEFLIDKKETDVKRIPY